MDKTIDKFNEIRKSLIAFLGALGTWGGTSAADGTYDQVELWGLCGVLVTALSVWGVRNHEKIRRSTNSHDEWPVR